MNSFRFGDFASKAMEVIKPPLQPASQGAGGSYGNGSILTQLVNSLTSENCNPNMDKEAVTPVKCIAKKTSVKSKSTALGENDLGKCPPPRRLDCNDGAHESRTVGKSPAKAALLKEPGASLHKHFCRSPRCAANNPDYAVSAPRQYLKSKRHLSAGWQPPLSLKLKTVVSATLGENTGHGCNSDNHDGLEGEHAEEHNEGEVLHTEPAVESAICGNGGDITQAGVSKGESQLTNSKCSTQEVPQIDTSNLVGAHGEEAVADVKDRMELPSLQPALSASDIKAFDTSMMGMSALTFSIADTSPENTENAEVIQSAETAATSNKISEELSMRVMNPESALLRTDPLRASKNTDSDFSMHSVGEDGSYRGKTCGSSCPPRRRYVKRGGRRLSSGTANNQSVSLYKQDGLKRKQADEWMWDTAIKEAVQRLAPRVPGSVNVLVKAFESVKLTVQEVQRAKYKNTAVGRLVPKNPPFQGGCEAAEPDVSHMETIASINKVQAWDESMASADLVDEVSVDKLVQDDENMAFTPKKAQAMIPRFSSKSEPPKVQWSRWASASDESLTIRDDTFSDKGASSISEKSRITEWTAERKGQAGQPHKQKLKRCTTLHPFRLRTEERGAIKEYVFSKRLQHMWEEEERLRIPLAQGLPWTTEEPAVLPKPPVKEQTKPEGFKLITDVRAVERAEFDEYIADRRKQEGLQKLEEERHRQIAEEEEIRRLRREMVPRAQLMPYFDRPFMPRRSSKKLTVPREPKFHLKQSKRPRCMASCNSSAA
ncbi:hypothetical protein M758_UG112300 [Ceratodon purpureus]|nr:hypothetical protein M758_UG112300 [Ceratodon purpureus]